MKKTKKMMLRSRIRKITAATTVAGSAVVFGRPGGVEHYFVPVFPSRNAEQGEETYQEVVETYVRLDAKHLESCDYVVLVVYLM
jgi:hypothetical protein